jgi:alpha-glucuronidase
MCGKELQNGRESMGPARRGKKKVESKPAVIPPEDGYELWLRYRKVEGARLLAQYRKAVPAAAVIGGGETSAVIRDELRRALPALLGCKAPVSSKIPSGPALVAGTVESLAAAGVKTPQETRRNLGDEGFLIRSGQPGADGRILITANSEPGVLHGVFHFLRLMQTRQDVRKLDISSRPRIRRRILAHWDNIDGSIERGYAGRSLWKWDDLPTVLDPRYRDYARACASIGINGVALNNVSAQAESLRADFLLKAAALADIFRPYGIRVYLTPNFAAPKELGGLATNDPLDPAVAWWWREKAEEIYRLIPDFGGFQVKANSEGMPGPKDSGANHDDGANMFARALEGGGGAVFWRAFVYDATIDSDRANCAYKEFTPLDGRFHPAVFIQVKNGPVDFQPREPFHPLFGSMERTPLALELQIAQEYLGQSFQLVYLAPMWKEVLDSDTFAKGPGSTVGRVVDGTLLRHADTAVIGDANTGADRNWCGHHFAQANWYAFGRLAWDHTLSAESIAEEWIRSTWTNRPAAVKAIRTLMLGSWEACIDYMTPLGLHHIMAEGHHYGPDPAFDAASRVDWTCVYYHRADSAGLGFDRSSTGTGAAAAYRSPLREEFNTLETCPEKFLLWFHHVPWRRRLSSGRTLWDELEHRYDTGIAFAEKMIGRWKKLHAAVDPRRHEQVAGKLVKQLENARFWKKVCLEYFGRFAQGGE